MGTAPALLVFFFDSAHAPNAAGQLLHAHRRTA